MGMTIKGTGAAWWTAGVGAALAFALTAAELLARVAAVCPPGGC